MNMIQQLDNEQIAKLSAGKDMPDFGPGDTVIVNVKVVEGERTRIQAYEGVCIGRSGGGPEREFHRPQDFVRRRRRARVPALLADDRSVKLVRRGKVRRAKLYYLRGLRGKSARIVERQRGEGRSGAE